MVLSLGLLKTPLFSILISFISRPQFIHIFDPIEIDPHLLHVFIFDLNELKLKNIRNNSKRGIKNISINIFPIKLIKKLSPKTGIIIKKINEYVINFLLFLKNKIIVDINPYSFFY
tara:strand:- start:1718 stop:2065 length:348 start_codon:yes stop_codon:yes gene_type:complete